jgi:hypothetical protein
MTSNDIDILLSLCPDHFKKKAEDYTYPNEVLGNISLVDHFAIYERSPRNKKYAACFIYYYDFKETDRIWFFYQKQDLSLGNMVTSRSYFQTFMWRNTSNNGFRRMVVILKMFLISLTYYRTT